MMNFDEIRDYWENRAAGDSSVQSTTQDVYLREIEFNAVSDHIQNYAAHLVADVGCGDGRTTTRLARKHPGIAFTGFDYSSSMIENARDVNAASDLVNIRFDQLDICDGLSECFELIYTTRCLINLPSWALQKTAINNILLSHYSFIRKA